LFQPPALRANRSRNAEKGHSGWQSTEFRYERTSAQGASSVERSATAVTDAEGRFEFTALAAGTFALSASRDGFDAPIVHHEVHVQDVTLADGEEQRDVVIRLTPHGAIAGRILDENRDPIGRMAVFAMVYQYTATGREWSNSFHAATNDRGEYRMDDVRPGRYYLKAGSMAIVNAKALRTYAVSYYHGTTDSAAAAAIEVGAGKTLDGINLTLNATKLASIRGRVTNRGKLLAVGLRVPRGDSWSRSFNDPDGQFELKGVSYVLTAESTVEGRRYSANLPMDIAGQIRIEGKSSHKPSELHIGLERGDRSGVPGSVKGDGSIAFQGLEATVYNVSMVPHYSDLCPKAVFWGDRDVTQSGVDLTHGLGAAESRLVVVMGTHCGQVEGVVEDDQSTPVGGALVALVSSSVTLSISLYELAQTGAKGQYYGQFRLDGVAPGRYKVFAWVDAEPDLAMYDPVHGKPLGAQGQSIEVLEGGKTNVRLKLSKQ
jgi:hypothetical protein